jgi:hypothetical protein
MVLTYVCDVYKTQEEAVLFASFAVLNKGDVADISAEIKLLCRLKDVLNELNIIRILFGDQRKVLKIMDGIVKSASKLAEEAAEVKAEDELMWGSDTGALLEKNKHVEARPHDLTLNQAPGSSKDSELEVDKSITSAKQGARHIWGSRGDPDDFSFPLDMVMTSLKDISAMIERAEKAERAVCLTFCRLIPPHADLVILAVDLDRGPEAEAQQRHRCAGVSQARPHCPRLYAHH